MSKQAQAIESFPPCTERGEYYEDAHGKLPLPDTPSMPRELFERLLKGEEKHVDRLEAQLHQMKELDYERYLESLKLGRLYSTSFVRLFTDTIPAIFLLFLDR